MAVVGDDLLEVVVDDDPDESESRRLHAAFALAVVVIIVAALVTAFSLHDPTPEFAVGPAEPMSEVEVAGVLRATCRSIKDEQRSHRPALESAAAYGLVARSRADRYGGLLEALSDVTPEAVAQGRVAEAEARLGLAVRRARDAMAMAAIDDRAATRAAVEEADEAATLVCQA